VGRSRRETAGIRLAIVKSPLSGSAVARELGVSESYVSRVRSGLPGWNDTSDRDAAIRASSDSQHDLARRHGLTQQRISQIRLGTPDDGWVAACMEPDEWALWLERNPRALGGAAIANRPCVDCPLGFAAEMRSEGRCNGSPGAVGGRHEEDDEEDDVIEPRSLGGVRAGTALELTPPPCGTCQHEPICVLKVALARAKTAEVAMASLPDGLSVAVSARVDCRFYNRVKGASRAPGRKLDLSDEERARRGAQARAMSEAKRARGAATA
jgi:hypothetical protein